VNAILADFQREQQNVVNLSMIVYRAQIEKSQLIGQLQQTRLELAQLQDQSFQQFVRICWVVIFLVISFVVAVGWRPALVPVALAAILLSSLWRRADRAKQKG
jgi:hypothetical protein